ncbi:Na+/H+ antiporter NhaA [Streptomyces sp. PSKA54]|uniref:Na(+)/H(+) antiporter NhaA n=1 Tax=Streptomyces himalayensis subsp. aureolus TaxID=2758039 RepID=A0A7W2D6R0_9ACTN|nr:Na+/H+ antiporter NhaA [Streptomyces himalayensis]MBA4865659.1 Na+/H+ antiporter NhaA [Streptomyces himalayensis subsp. aureolus]
MTDSTAPSPPSGRISIRGGERTPLRDFLRTETGSAVVLLAATLVALVWANIAHTSYESFWHTRLSITVGDQGVALPLREWVNAGLMTLFFFVVGLEARREFDMGELRDRRALSLPAIAGLCGMIVPIVVYLAINAGRPSVHGWGAAMSTDTAFALGMLALLGSRFPDRLRTFILTVAVVDDFLALVVIAVFYSEDIDLPALLAALGIFGVILLVRAAGVRHGWAYALLGAAAWVAAVKSGVDPVVVGLALGLLTYAYPASRSELERATGLFRAFREQPTPELERSLRQGLRSAMSPNDRLLQMYHPWTSYVIVPLFALANMGIAISGDLLARAYTSPVTLGILCGFVLGKPIGIVGAAWLANRLSRGRMRPQVGWGSVVGGGTIAGVGFTVSLLIVTLAFEGDQLEEAKIGILSAVVGAFAATWVVALCLRALPPRRRAQALLGTAETMIDLAVPVDPDRDHVRGPAEAPVTIVEYGDFECPYCGQAEPVVRELLAGHASVRYVWRHLPLTDVHPHAQLAAEAAECAAQQGAFWEMHDLLFDHQGALEVRDLVRYAEQLGLDTELFRQALRERAGAAKVAEDVESADLSGVSGTPTFFINDRRHLGAYDIEALSAAVHAAKTRAVLRAG